MNLTWFDFAVPASLYITKSDYSLYFALLELCSHLLCCFCKKIFTFLHYILFTIKFKPNLRIELAPSLVFFFYFFWFDKFVFLLCFTAGWMLLYLIRALNSTTGRCHMTVGRCKHFAIWAIIGSRCPLKNGWIKKE